jgi:pyruvate/2-oxoglutarate dehydrogenase complex dihydrolipoamide acyltransferase (E2) component
VALRSGRCPVARQNQLLDGPSRPATDTAVKSVLDLLPRPRPAAPAAPLKVRGPAPSWDAAIAAAGARRAAGAVDRDEGAARPDPGAPRGADLDDEYFDVLELPAEEPIVEPVADPAAESVPDATTAEGRSDRPARTRRLPAVPRRRPALLLAAAVAGALIALAGGGPGGVAAPPTASGLDYGLGLEEPGFAGGVDVAGARGEISQAEAQARLAEIAASRAARQPAFVLPTQGRLTTCFCTRWGAMHWGIDLAAPLGTPILAAADGVVLRAGPATGYGNAIYIQDADGNVEIYGHMRYLFVHAGDVVSAGDTIAKVGSEGQSTGPHLHFEIHQGGMTGRPTDPQKWLADRSITVG